MARAVWALKDDDSIMSLFGDETHDPKLWLFSLSNKLNRQKIIEVLVTLWAIWWARRKLNGFANSKSAANYLNLSRLLNR